MFDQYNNQENEKREYNAGFDNNANDANYNQPKQQSFSEQTEGWLINPQAEETPTNWYTSNAETQNYNAGSSAQPQQSDATNGQTYYSGEPASSWPPETGYGQSQQYGSNYTYPNYDYSGVYDNLNGKPPKKEKKSGHGGWIAVTLAAAVVLSGTIGFAGGYLGNQYASNSSGTNKVIYQSVQRTSTGSGSDSDQLSVADVAALTADSVVEITTESVTTGKFMQQYVSEGAGSGVIITSDGYIATNNHVIDGASKITVRLKNGTVYEATLIGKDAKTDIAVLKIEAKDLNAAVYGDSGKLVVGETAIAIGNPLGELGGTVTSGIISALDRSITIDGETMTLLQTNAAINPGNSGGGLFNQYGELIGIVNAKSSGSDIEGLGFAIPINTAKPVIEEIIENGYVRGRISLGLTIVDISDTETAMAYRVSKTGVYVTKTTSASAQFQAGDRIVSFNGESIDSAEALTAAINKCKVGDTVEVVVERRNQKYTFNLTLQEEKPE